MPKSRYPRGLVGCPPVHRTPRYVSHAPRKGVPEQGKLISGTRRPRRETPSRKETLSVSAFSSCSQHEKETRVKMIKLLFPGHLFCVGHCPEGSDQDEPHDRGSHPLRLSDEGVEAQGSDLPETPHPEVVYPGFGPCSGGFQKSCPAHSEHSGPKRSPRPPAEALTHLLPRRCIVEDSVLEHKVSL